MVANASGAPRRRAPAPDPRARAQVDHPREGPTRPAGHNVRAARRSGAGAHARPTTAQSARRRRHERELPSSRHGCGRASQLQQRRSQDRRARRADDRWCPCRCRGRWCAPGWQSWATSRSERGSVTRPLLSMRQEVDVDFALALARWACSACRAFELLARKLAAVAIAARPSGNGKSSTAPHAQQSPPRAENGGGSP